MTVCHLAITNLSEAGDIPLTLADGIVELLGDAHVSHVVLDGGGHVPQQGVGVPQTVAGLGLHRAVAQLLSQH